MCVSLFREAFFSLDTAQQQVVLGSALAAAGLLVYTLTRRGPVRKIPVREGWWGAGDEPLVEDHTIHSFKVQTSDEEIEVICCN